MCVCLSLSLPLAVYIYIYIYIHTAGLEQDAVVRAPEPRAYVQPGAGLDVLIID